MLTRKPQSHLIRCYFLRLSAAPIFHLFSKLQQKSLQSSQSRIIINCSTAKYTELQTTAHLLIRSALISSGRTFFFFFRLLIYSSRTDSAILISLNVFNLLFTYSVGYQLPMEQRHVYKSFNFSQKHGFITNNGTITNKI